MDAMENPSWDDLHADALKRGFTDKQARAYATNSLQQMEDIMIGDPARAATTNLLRKIHARSVELGYNRLISEEGVARLHPDGVHILKPLLIHRHAWGEPVDAHVRTEALVRMQGDAPGTEPSRATLDMTMEDFLSLPSVAAIKEQWANGLDAQMPDGTILPPPGFTVSDDIHGPQGTVAALNS